MPVQYNNVKREYQEKNKVSVTRECFEYFDKMILQKFDGQRENFAVDVLQAEKIDLMIKDYKKLAKQIDIIKNEYKLAGWEVEWRDDTHSQYNCMHFTFYSSDNGADMGI